MAVIMKKTNASGFFKGEIIEKSTQDHTEETTQIPNGTRFHSSTVFESKKVASASCLCNCSESVNVKESRHQSSTITHSPH